jgi:type VI secretion system protein ImpA
MNRTIDSDRIRRPISESSPTGDYLYDDPVYRKIDAARLPTAGPDGRPRDPDWNGVARLGLEAMQDRTKDLQIAAYVTEALGWLEGLEGLRQGFQLLLELQDAYWDSIHPRINEGDLSPRLEPYDFVELTVPPILHIAIPVTRSSTGENFNLQRFQAVHSPSEKDAWDEAIRRTDASFHQGLAGELAACCAAFDAWTTNTAVHLGREAPPLRRVRSFLEELNSCLKTIASIRPFPAPAKTPEGAVNGEEMADAPPRPLQPARDSSPPGQAASNGETVGETVARRGLDLTVQRGDAQGDLARDARELADAGRIDAGIELLDLARRAARCRRDRFIRQLELVELCVRGGLIPLARPLLDELADELETRKLEEWEDPVLCGRVLEASLACLHASRTEEDVRRIPGVFERLCRLDPRRALENQPRRG